MSPTSTRRVQSKRSLQRRYNDYEDWLSAKKRNAYKTGQTAFFPKELAKLAKYKEQADREKGILSSEEYMNKMWLRHHVLNKWEHQGSKEQKRRLHKLVLPLAVDKLTTANSLSIANQILDPIITNKIESYL